MKYWIKIARKINYCSDSDSSNFFNVSISLIGCLSIPQRSGSTVGTEESTSTRLFYRGDSASEESEDSSLDYTKVPLHLLGVPEPESLGLVRKAQPRAGTCPPAQSVWQQAEMTVRKDSRKRGGLVEWEFWLEVSPPQKQGGILTHQCAARRDQAQKDSVQGMSKLGTIANNFLNNV